MSSCLCGRDHDADEARVHEAAMLRDGAVEIVTTEHGISLLLRVYKDEAMSLWRWQWEDLSVDPWGYCYYASWGSGVHVNRQHAEADARQYRARDTAGHGISADKGWIRG